MFCRAATSRIPSKLNQKPLAPIFLVLASWWATKKKKKKPRKSEPVDLITDIPLFWFSSYCRCFGLVLSRMNALIQVKIRHDSRYHWEMHSACSSCNWNVHDFKSERALMQLHSKKNDKDFSWGKWFCRKSSAIFLMKKTGVMYCFLLLLFDQSARYKITHFRNYCGGDLSFVERFRIIGVILTNLQLALLCLSLFRRLLETMAGQRKYSASKSRASRFFYYSQNPDLTFRNFKDRRSTNFIWWRIVNQIIRRFKLWMFGRDAATLSGHQSLPICSGLLGNHLPCAN